MLVLVQALRRIFKRPEFQRAKPFTLHCSLILLVLGYAFAGGFVFNRLEADAYNEQQNNDRKIKTDCVVKVLSKFTTWSVVTWRNQTIDRVVACFEPERDERSEWSFVTATLFGFGVVTTLGYNRISPITYAGRLFCIVYGICGIPLTMIIIANVGQYLNTFAGNSRRKLEAYRTQRRMSKASLSGKEYKESSIQVTSLVLLAVFLLYVAMGALLLPALNGQIDFFNGLYYNFLCLTAIDFGQLVPSRVALLPITFLYVCLGLAITTIAIDIGSEYMKKLHYLGKKMKNAASTKIWFGGKTLKVRDLLHAVGKKCGVEPGLIDALDLENVVERTIAMQEGRDPPEDTNDEPPIEPSPHSRTNSAASSRTPSEGSPFITMHRPAPIIRQPCPDLVIKNPIFHTLSNEMSIYSPLYSQPVFPASTSFCKIDSPVPVSDDEECDVISIKEPPNVEYIVLPPSIVEPFPIMDVSMTSSTSSAVSHSETLEEKVPKKFREKRNMYGRDPRKLFETYREEWGRLERLNDKKYGGRRKSIMQGFSPDRSRSPSMNNMGSGS